MISTGQPSITKKFGDVAISLYKRAGLSLADIETSIDDDISMSDILVQAPGDVHECSRLGERILVSYSDNTGFHCYSRVTMRFIGMHLPLKLRKFICRACKFKSACCRIAYNCPLPTVEAESYRDFHV